MSTGPIGELAPIYSQLVMELGDVVADTRKVAEQVQAQAREALDFRGARRVRRAGEAGAFSAFGL